MTKSLHPELATTLNSDVIGRSYYIYCLEQALVNLQRARVLVQGDVIEESHELPKIERLLTEAIVFS